MYGLLCFVDVKCIISNEILINMLFCFLFYKYVVKVFKSVLIYVIDVEEQNKISFYFEL